MAETDVRELQHVLLDYLRDVLDPLGGCLRSVRQRLPASVYLGQSSLERRGGPWSLAVVSGSSGRELRSLGSRMRRDFFFLTGEIWCCQQGSLGLGQRGYWS